MRVLLAHPGTQHAFRLARELDQRQLLGEFWTGLAWRDGGLAARAMASLRRVPGLSGLNSRVARHITPSRVHAVRGNELRALWQLKRGAEPLTVLYARNLAFQEAIPDSHLRQHTSIIGFDTSAWQFTARARRMGIPLYLDRTIAHPAHLARLFADMRVRYPDWFAPEPPRPDFLVQAEANEHAGAHRIVVGSSFGRDTLLHEGIASEKIIVNPYGVDWSRFARPTTPRSEQPLRFIFLGSILGRKGVPVLLDAWRALASRRNGAELWLVGHCGPRERSLLPDLPGLHYLGLRPHHDIPHLLTQADVFVLPSLLEGFSLALLEAVASGLPVIATPNTGAADLLGEPALGQLVPAGSTDALTEAMATYLRAAPDRQRIAQAAEPLAAKFSWTAYGERWQTIVTQT